MIVRVGTRNAIKIRAVRSAVRLFFPRSRVEGIDIPSGVSRKPSSLAEIIRGARNRAKRCRGDADYGVGIEAGHFRLDGRPYLITIACVTDGRRATIGGSPFFEYDLATAPPSYALRAPAYGIPAPAGKPAGKRDATGIIGALTRRKVTREEVTRWAVVMALAGRER